MVSLRGNSPSGHLFVDPIRQFLIAPTGVMHAASGHDKWVTTHRMVEGNYMNLCVKMQHYLYGVKVRQLGLVVVGILRGKYNGQVKEATARRGST